MRESRAHWQYKESSSPTKLLPTRKLACDPSEVQKIATTHLHRLRGEANTRSCCNFCHDRLPDASYKESWHFATRARKLGSVTRTVPGAYTTATTFETNIVFRYEVVSTPDYNCYAQKHKAASAVPYVQGLFA